MAECFSKEEFSFLDRDIATDDGNLVKALREIRRLQVELAQARDRLEKLEAFANRVADNEFHAPVLREAALAALEAEGRKPRTEPSRKGKNELA